MSRLLGVFLALLLLFLGARWAPSAGGAREWRPLVRLLGPLRAVWADVLLIQFEERALQQDVFALTEQARQILRLRPDQPGYWVYFGQFLALDLASVEADPDLRRERVRQGLQILREGASTLTASPQVPAALADTLWALALDHPDWLRGQVEDPLGEALDAYRLADSRAPEALGTDWAMRLRLFLEGMLRAPERLPGRAAEIRQFAEDLAGRPGLAEEAREALRRALEASGGVP